MASRLYACTLDGRVRHRMSACLSPGFLCDTTYPRWRPTLHVINGDCPCKECERGGKLRICKNCERKDGE